MRLKKLYYLSIFLLQTFFVLGQDMELYPGEYACFCVPTAETKYAGTTKKGIVEVDQFVFKKCSPSTTYTLNISPSIKIRDTTNAAYAATDYYNQLAIDSINQLLRSFVSTNMPILGGEDEIGFIFTSRTKDPPSAASCTGNLGGGNGTFHTSQLVLALETINGNYRHGLVTGSRQVGIVTVRMKFTDGGGTTTQLVSAGNAFCTPYGPPDCPLTCAPEFYYLSPYTGVFLGHFTKKSIPRIFRQARNEWHMEHNGYWAGYPPYSDFLIESGRRCRTVFQMSCTDLTLSDNNTLADKIISTNAQGDCMFNCSSYQGYFEPYFKFTPFNFYPTPTNGTLTFENTINTGGYGIYRNGSLVSSGVFPNISIDLGPITTFDNGVEFSVIINTNGIKTFSIIVESAVCSSSGTIGDITTQLNASSCYGSQNGKVVNLLPFNSGIDSTTAVLMGNPIVYQKYTEYQKYISTTLGNPTTIDYYTVAFKKGVCSAKYHELVNNRVCPCVSNRLIEFNSNGIDIGKKTTLTNLGWIVKP